MQLPLIGLGTWELRGAECTKVVKLALELGYRHFDTAHAYENHKAIRSGIKGFDRSALFLTSKIALDEQVKSSKIEQSVQKACAQALKELGTDYLDLYMIHWPDRHFPLDAVFEAMQGLVDEGKVARVGVSNYNTHHLEDLRKAGWVPFANQVEFHPYLNQKELFDYCRKAGIQLISYRPFGKGKLLQEEPLFDQIGEKHGKTGAQVILRWLIQHEIAVIPKASSKKHLKENLDVFDFALSPRQVQQLDHIHQSKRFCQPEHPEFKY